MRKVMVNPALMMVVQLDSAPAAATQTSTRPSTEDAEDRVDARDGHRSAALQNAGK